MTKDNHPDRITNKKLDEFCLCAGIRRAKREWFRKKVSAAIDWFLSSKEEPKPKEIRDAIDSLHSACKGFLDGKNEIGIVAFWLEELPESARPYLERGYHKLPATSELDLPPEPKLCDLRKQRKLVEHILGLCTSGADWKEGRNRPSGKQSRPTLNASLVGPRKRGQPFKCDERVLISLLAVCYDKATGGRRPVRLKRWGKDDSDIEARHEPEGPFFELIKAVLKEVSPGTSAAEMIRWYETKLPPSQTVK